MVGGLTTEDTDWRYLLRLDSAVGGNWYQMDQKLKAVRYFHVAFLVANDLVNCHS